MVPIPKAVRIRTASGWQDVAIQGAPGVQGPGGLITAMRSNGQYDGYNGGGFTPIAANQLWCDAGGTIPLRLTYTPPIDCWWDTWLNAGLVQKTDAAYHYGMIRSVLSPADVDGLDQAISYCNQHASVQTYENYQVPRMWKLAAGVAYTLNGQIQCSGGTWQYYAGRNTLFLDGKVYARGTGPTSIIPVVTTLPTTPLDGQEVYYLANDAQGVIWHLRYRAGSASAYKWEAIGPIPLTAEVATSEAYSSGGYGDPATPGPSIALPRPGDYIIESGFQSTGAVGTWPTAIVLYGAVVPTVGDPEEYSVGGNTATETAGSRKLRKNGLTAVTAKLAYRTQGAITLKKRWLSVTPVRLS